MRLVGARPMDESITNDYFHRLKVYQAKDRAKLDNLREAVRKSVISGGTLEQEQYGKFAEEYMKAGGKQKNFNKWVVDQYMKANTPASKELAESLSYPYAHRMKEFMRGREVTTEDLGCFNLQSGYQERVRCCELTPKAT
jgi:hypothetical protein